MPARAKASQEEKRSLPVSEMTLKRGMPQTNDENDGQNRSQRDNAGFGWTGSQETQQSEQTDKPDGLPPWKCDVTRETRHQVASRQQGEKV